LSAGDLVLGDRVGVGSDLLAALDQRRCRRGADRENPGEHSEHHRLEAEHQTQRSRDGHSQRL